MFRLAARSSAPIAVRVWRRLDRARIEQCRVDEAGGSLAGSLAVVLDDRRVQVAYTVDCSTAWESGRSRYGARPGFR